MHAEGNSNKQGITQNKHRRYLSPLCIPSPRPWIAFVSAFAVTGGGARFHPVYYSLGQLESFLGRAERTTHANLPQNTPVIGILAFRDDDVSQASYFHPGTNDTTPTTKHSCLRNIALSFASVRHPGTNDTKHALQFLAYNLPPDEDVIILGGRRRSSRRGGGGTSTAGRRPQGRTGPVRETLLPTRRSRRRRRRSRRSRGDATPALLG